MLEGYILTVLLAAEALNPLLMQDGGCHTPPLEYCLSMSPIPNTHRSIPPPPSHKSHQNLFSNITCSINSVLVVPALHDHKSHLSEVPRPMDGSLGKQMSSSQAVNSPQLAWCAIQGLSTESRGLDRASLPFWLVTPQDAIQVTCCSGDLLLVSLENTA